MAYKLIDISAAAIPDGGLYHLEGREDGHTCVLEGDIEGQGRVVDCFNTVEDAESYLSTLVEEVIEYAAEEVVPEEESMTVEQIGEAGPELIPQATNVVVVPNNGFSTTTNSTIHILSHAELTGPPAEFFTNPELTELQRWTTITDEGRVFGHSAGNDECHIGILDRCVTIADIADGLVAGCNWEYSMPGHVVTADGTKVGTGPIPVKGGHADKSLDWIGAIAHYDDPATVVADVVYGRDEFGIWFSGFIRPTATPAMVYALRASGVSLDARGIGSHLRYLTTCCVNTPGLPKADGKIAADGAILTLVAAGGSPLPHPDLCGCQDAKDIESLKKLVADAGITDIAIDKLSSRIPASEEELDELYNRVNA